MNISIVIPNYNGEAILKKNIPILLESIKNYKKGKVEIIISDDGSTDSSIEVISDFEKKYVNVKLLRSEKNEGFSANVNKGVAASQAEIIILLNTDVIANDSFIDPLIDHFSDELVFAVGCLNESIENGKVVMRGRGIGKWEKGFLIHRAGDLDKENTLWISGGSGAFSKKIWDKLNGLDEIYDPFYWEDIDISYRAQRAGYKTLFEKKSVVRHEHEKGAIKSRYTKGEIKRIAYRNQFIFVWKNADFKNLFFHFLWLPYHIVTGLKGDKILVLGFISALFKIFFVFKSRFKSRRQFRVSDNSVMEKYTT